MMNSRQTRCSPPVLTLLLIVLFWHDMTAVQAGPTRSRFDRAYPTISRLIQPEESRVDAMMMACTAEAILVERWSVSIPPWYESGMKLRLPTSFDRPEPLTRIPDAIRVPIQTRASEGGDDEDEEPSMTDYDYQEWLTATPAPAPDGG